MKIPNKKKNLKNQMRLKMLAFSNLILRKLKKCLMDIQKSARAKMMLNNLNKKSILMLELKEQQAKKIRM